MDAVEVRGISKRYGEIVALSGVNLEVRDGEYLCIIGPSGSGKSTLLKVIAGIVQPDEGRVLIFGEDVTWKPVEERGVSLVFQEILLFPHMDVMSNIAYPLEAAGDENVTARAKEIASNFSVELMLSRLPAEISLGDQQKVAIARAVASGARVLLMDEPYGSIDPVTSLELRHEIKLLAKSLGITVVHVTHNQEEALSVADRIAVMRRGRVEQVGTPLELYFKPRNPFVARFIGGENNFFVGRVAERRGTKLRVDLGFATLDLEGSVTDGKVVVAVRPEHFRFSEEGLLEGRVVLREFLGSYYRYIIDYGGGKVIVKTFERVDVGERVRLSFDPRIAVCFEYPEEGLEEAIRYE